MFLVILVALLPPSPKSSNKSSTISYKSASSIFPRQNYLYLSILLLQLQLQLLLLHLLLFFNPTEKFHCQPRRVRRVAPSPLHPRLPRLPRFLLSFLRPQSSSRLFILVSFSKSVVSGVFNKAYVFQLRLPAREYAVSRLS